MKIRNKLFLSCMISGLLSFSSVFAGGIDHFDVKIEPGNAKVGEALDITIEALDKNNATVTDYNGTVLIFSESDPEVELPNLIEENTYTFEAANQGKIKFENGLKFKNVGTQDVYVYEIEDDTVLGVGEAIITKDVVEKNIDINIISPEEGLTIGEGKIKISGKTNKNYNIKIIINGKREETTVSNDDGLYEKTLENLENGENTFKAQVLNADNAVIGESSIVKIKVNSNLPVLKSLKVTPKEVNPEEKYNIEVIANKGLASVSVIINDSVIKLEEKEDGVYIKNAAHSPKDSGSYKIDVILKDELGNEVKELGAGNLNVKTIELAAAKEEKPKEPTTCEEKPLTGSGITGLKLIELKTKSVLTWDKVENAESYNVYKKIQDDKLELIQNTTDSKFEIEIVGKEMKYEYFAVKAVGKTCTGETYEGNLSEATKIQTGPELLILLVLSILMGGFIFFINTKKSA